MLDPRYLDLVIRQVQGNMGLENMSDPRHLDFAVMQVHVNNHPPLSTFKGIAISSLGTPKGMVILLWHTQGNELIWVWKT
jgi:hypothetical protein